MAEQASTPETANMREAFEETDLCLRRVVSRLRQMRESSNGEGGGSEADEGLERAIKRSRRQIRANRELLGPVKGKAEGGEEAEAEA